ncbi:MAG: hypothetical protein H0A76_05830 [Candidatus Thiodubiliella endoseptemdiera]|uniref:Uncharacterized protein n=1 Tax=Candidatus Thiodubiliella endoseptemdiera TaxID=2738886 RepID=A0A853F1R2_9GAMM|nr:hypothetical protein [Candidatus Thiodubiliella endoseptemdiera]
MEKPTRAVVTLSDGNQIQIPSTSTAVTYETPLTQSQSRPTMDSKQCSSRAICFKAGDIISLTPTMSETLKLNNTTGSKVVIAGKDLF